MLPSGFENLDKEQQLIIGKITWRFLQRILSLTLLPAHEKKLIAKLKPSLTNNPHFDPEELRKELNLLLDKMREVVKPRLQEEFLIRLQNDFWHILEKVEAEAIEQGYQLPAEEHYKKVVDQFTLADLSFNHIYYCRQRLFC